MYMPDPSKRYSWTIPAEAYGGVNDIKFEQNVRISYPSMTIGWCLFNKNQTEYMPELRAYLDTLSMLIDHEGGEWHVTHTGVAMVFSKVVPFDPVFKDEVEFSIDEW